MFRTRENKIAHTHDMRMVQTGNETSLDEKLFCVIACRLCMEYFDGGQSAEVYMLSQVDLSKSASSKQTDEMIVAKLLTDSISHT